MHEGLFHLFNFFKQLKLRLSPAAASDVGLAPAAPSLSPAGGRPERMGPGPEGSVGWRASQQGQSPRRAARHGYV